MTEQRCLAAIASADVVVFCGIGSWGGRRPSLADYVRGRRPPRDARRRSRPKGTLWRMLW